MDKIYRLEKGENLQLSDNFNSSEFECPCKDERCQTVIKSELQLRRLERLRQLELEEIGDSFKGFTPNSSHRCPRYNKSERISGSDYSDHIYGTGDDIPTDNPQRTARNAEKAGFEAIGIYNSFIHVGTRSHIARWDRR